MALADQDGEVAVLKAYMDESGVHDGSEAITVAAYVGRPSDWQQWTKMWNAAKRPIKVYHAVDAQNRTGEFRGWTQERVAELVKRLLPITAESRIAAVVVGMNLNEFRKAVDAEPTLRELFGNPYVACLHWTIQIILNLMFETNNKERIAFIHENNSYHGGAYEVFDWIKKYGSRGKNIISLTFGSKEDYPPLQAADILAYEGNKRLRDPSRPERRPWTALGANEFVLHYGKDNMAELVERLKRVRLNHINGRDLGDGLDLGDGWRRAAWPGGRE